MLSLPFKGNFRISQRFGQNMNNFYKLEGKLGHGGIDFAMPNGTPIISACDGDVIFTTDPKDSARTGWGVSILSDNFFSYNGTVCRLSCLYAHLKEGSLKVKRGDRVKAGDLIALSNNSGQTTGPHLHFAVCPVNLEATKELAKENGYGGYVDPAPYLPFLENKIKELQRFLNNYGAALIVDGKFGPRTNAALEAFTKKDY